MNKDKIIKDLKERNEKLSNQYRLRDIRCIHLEMENADLQEKLAVVNEMNVANYNKYCEVLKENTELKEKTEYLKSKIENKDRWCQLIADIGYDYDGYRKAENLMKLIDELVKYALYSRDNYDYFQELGGDVDDE